MHVFKALVGLKHLHCTPSSLRRCEWALCGHGHGVSGLSTHQGSSKGLNGPMWCGVGGGACHQGEVGLRADIDASLVMSCIKYTFSRCSRIA